MLPSGMCAKNPTRYLYLRGIFVELAVFLAKLLSPCLLLGLGEYNSG